MDRFRSTNFGSLLVPQSFHPATTGMARKSEALDVQLNGLNSCCPHHLYSVRIVENSNQMNRKPPPVNLNMMRSQMMKKKQTMRSLIMREPINKQKVDHQIHQNHLQPNVWITVDTPYEPKSTPHIVTHEVARVELQLGGRWCNRNGTQDIWYCVNYVWTYERNDAFVVVSLMIVHCSFDIYKPLSIMLSSVQFCYYASWIISPFLCCPHASHVTCFMVQSTCWVSMCFNMCLGANQFQQSITTALTCLKRKWYMLC